MSKRSPERLKQIVMQRVYSLHNDGYYTMFKSDNEDFGIFFIRLRHRNRPTMISIYAHLRDDYMIQRRDGKIVYTGEITP